MSNNSTIQSSSHISRTSPRPYFQRQILRRGEYSGFMIFLFLLLAAYMVIPLIDVPFLGLSLSAPVFALIALQALFRPPEPWFKQFQGWIILAILIWLGVFLSVVGNGLRSGGTAIDTEGWLNIIHFAYWLLVFVVTAYFTSRQDLLPRVSRVLGWAVFGLGLVRLFEAVAWGKIGAWTGTELMAQNSYGFGFSMFFPFLLAPIVASKGGSRLLMILRLLLVGAAVLINGSRSSWITVSVEVMAFALLYTLANPKKLGWSLAIVALSALALLAFQFAPDQVTAAFDERFGTFQKLEEDKSFMIRELMVQKGVKLFRESPLIGVGVSRFTKESTPLNIPRVLSYADQSHFDSKSAHNSYIAFLAETGLAGSLPFVTLLLVLGLRGLKSSLALARRGQVYALGIYAGFLGMSVHMWSINSLTNTANWFLYGLAAALIVVAGRQNE